MTRKYGKKASEKIERALHEFKRGTLKTSAGQKVTSREQAIAIGLSQARRAGGKVPPARHATMSIDARVRAHLSGMRPGSEIDACGLARAIGGVDPLEVDYALERAAKAGLAVTVDGRWFGPSNKRSPAQLDRDIAESLAHSTKRDRFQETLIAGQQRNLRRRGVVIDVNVDTSEYRRTHGAEPRGRGDWTFVIGKTSYQHSDDPALYRPGVPGVLKLPFSRAKELAIAEAKRRGATVVGLSP